ncbi:MAG TPA: metal ABC transporter substrate-binding protein [Acidimicrobiia bacterium]|nr:metal ABC transporter substrate-binding protein [Acidimicrobiia bacterium]
MRNLLLMPVLLAMLLGGCGTSPAEETGRPLVVATTSIWGDVARSIVGDQGSVEVLIPVGADAHDYEPSQRQVAMLQEADLVIANGLGLEEGLHDILESAEADGARVFEVAPKLDPIEFGDHHLDHDDDHDTEDAHDHDDLDPHVWFDPIRMASSATLIAERLADVAPDVDWAARADAYVTELEQLDAEIEEILGVVPDAQRKMVTNHEALGYFAHRYGFEVIGVVIPGGSTLADPSSADLAALVAEMLEEGVSTIFAETSQPNRLAEAVAAEVGEEVSVVELYTESLGETRSGAATLVGMLRSNAIAIADALSR